MDQHRDLLGAAVDRRRSTTRHVLSALAAGVGIGIYISRTGSLQIIGARARMHSRVATSSEHHAKTYELLASA
jgi:hypothetical protein